MLNVIDRTLRKAQRVVRGTHPLVDQLLTTLVYYYAFSWIKAARIINSIQYDAPINPMQIHYVDPQQIDRTISWTRISTDLKADEHPRFRPPNYRLASRVFDGDWDTVETRVTESTIHQSFVRHFKNDIPWEETTFYEEALDTIEAGASPWDCTCQEDLNERCKTLDNLYDRIATEDYKTQDELHQGGDQTTSPYRLYRVLWGEIAINIGRDGEYIFQDGRNRLAIARILGIDKVPVVILVRHEKWQQTRDLIIRGELSRSDVSERLSTHPDLIDLF